MIRPSLAGGPGKAPSPKWAGLVAASLALSCDAWAQGGTSSLSYPGCAPLQASDFRRVVLGKFPLGGVTKIVVAPDGRVFGASQSGWVVAWDPATKEFQNMGQVPNVGGGKYGMIGIALDPAFPTNGRIYLNCCRPVEDDLYLDEIRRYTVRNNRVDLTTEKVLLAFPNNRKGIDHSAGGMAFDPAGNLVIGTGDNTDWRLQYGEISEVKLSSNAMRSSANANDLRGKILRIRPKPLAEADPAPAPGAGTTYDIPEGNLFPAGLEGMRPEIYAMGNRNPFTLTVDQATGWVFWADVGPQGPKYTPEYGPAGMDEFNVAPTAGNYGWPMFIGPNLPYNNYDYEKNVTGPLFNPLLPENGSKLNTGIRQLPPPRPSLVAYGKDSLNNPWPGFRTGLAVPIAGPVYHYNGSNPSPYKLPPHFDGKWIVANHIQGWFKVITFDSKGEKALDVQPVFEDMASTFLASRLLDVQASPDGALYVLDYHGQNLHRIEYVGTCRPAVAIRKRNGRGAVPSGGLSYLAPGRKFLDVPAGRKGFSLLDLRGRTVWSWSARARETAASVPLPSDLGPGLHQIRWEN